MQSENALGNQYTGNTIINAGTLTLENGVGAAGESGGSPNIIVNAGGRLALNAADVLGYTNGKEALTINSGGTVSNVTSGSRVTIQNLITMTGGVLTGTGTGDANGQYSFNNAAAGINATSDAFGNPSVISAKISPQTGNILFTVKPRPRQSALRSERDGPHRPLRRQRERDYHDGQRHPAAQCGEHLQRRGDDQLGHPFVGPGGHAGEGRCDYRRGRRAGRFGLW